MHSGFQGNVKVTALSFLGGATVVGSSSSTLSIAATLALTGALDVTSFSVSTSKFTVSSAGDITSANTQDDATGVTWTATKSRTTGTSCSDNDVIWQLSAVGYNDNATPAAKTVANVKALITDATDTSEDGAITFEIMVTGVAAAEKFRIANVLTASAALTVGVDDTGYDVTFYGATSGKKFLWDESEDALSLNGWFIFGTSGTPETTSTADKKFISVYTESTATSGDSRGMYLKHKLGGTIASTGYGDAGRFWAEVTGTDYSYASGIHSTMSVAAGATVAGSGAGLIATLGAAAESRTLTGALAALQVDSDIAIGNTVPDRCSLIRMSKSGSVDIPFAFDIADDQCLQGAAAAGAGLDALKVILPNGTTGYINIIELS